ncbi:related to OTU domain-containing protein 2 [Saccharomycodes ludwigii]|uniref:Related to OTU domain-containing protein 2 n=2 Tax=Saccharomycodes ludwigii TaxID=36035 RepID=A0A376BAW7_9ASCO|nr:related to OTU domain-containing protein 2 [Saccharomycodes ludwigii]
MTEDGQKMTEDEQKRQISKSDPQVSLTFDALLKKHRKEKKDLQNQITGMKKQASKSKRKQINNRCIELEEKLKLDHEQELKNWKVANNMIDENDEDDNDNYTEITPEKLIEQLSLSQDPSPEKTSSKNDNYAALPQPTRRRNRQREKLAKREAEIQRIKEEARKEAYEQPDLKKIEQETLEKIYEIKSLKQVDIKPDGHCLFASILDQLKLRHSNVQHPYCFPQTYTKNTHINDLDVYDLRSLAACHIREHSNDFTPYLFDESTMSLKDVNQYTKSLEETACWGGDVELMALSNIFQCCIAIISSGKSTIIINEDKFKSMNPELKLVYYKHSYALGEHYNSLHDI